MLSNRSNRQAPVERVELHTAFDNASEDGYSVNEFYTRGIGQENTGTPPIPPRNKPPTPPPYNAAVKRGISPVQNGTPKCSGQCACPFCPVKNGIPPQYFAMLINGNAGVNDQLFCPVNKQPREDFGNCSSASNSPRNSMFLLRSDSKILDELTVLRFFALMICVSEGVTSDAAGSARAQLSSQSNRPSSVNSRVPVIKDK